MLTQTPFDDAKHGFAVSSLSLRDYSADKAVDGDLIKSASTIEKFNRVQSDENSQLWRDEKNTVTIHAVFVKTDAGSQIVIDVHNDSLTQQVTRIDFQLPTITFPASSDYKVYTGYRGGILGNIGLKDWQSGQGNTGAWPGYCTSPVVSIWDDKTKDTIAYTFFNDALRRVTMFWFSGPGGASNELQCFNPFLRFEGNLEPNDSMKLTVDLAEMTGGASAHWADYRKRFLQPFMARFGFPESATFSASGIWAGDASSGAGLAFRVKQIVANYRITGYIAWPSPDGQSELYEPHQVRQPFFSEFLETSQIPGLKSFGTLIIPDSSPRQPTDPALAQKIHPADNRKPYIGAASDLMLNQHADFVRLYNLSYAKLLRDHGITVAYYDTGGGPAYDRSPIDWLRTYADFKRAGIAVMGECGADVSAWISGVWMEYPYNWSDYSMLKELLPGASLFAYMQWPDRRNGVSSWQDAESKGVIPILQSPLLAQRFRERAGK